MAEYIVNSRVSLLIAAYLKFLNSNPGYQASSRSIDLLIWHANHEVAKAVTLFGPGVVVLPLLGRVSGVEDEGCLAYSGHPKRMAKGGVLDRVDMEMKFGPWDPKRLMEELMNRKKGLEKRMQRMSDEDLQEEVHALQDWREKATGRLKTLERRAAWSFLGVAGEGTASQEDIKKAFKKRALELHPDKGGDAERFRLLQEMRDLLVEPKHYELEGKDKSEAGPGKKSSKSKGKEEDEKEEEEEEDSELSEDSWDADEELRKMFPKRKKRSRRSAEDVEPESLHNQDFHRGKFEAARRKLHRQLGDMWARASKLCEEIVRSQTTSSGAEALRQLRNFVELFSRREVSKLQENDPTKAQRILRRFLEQGSEVLCAAGAVDPAAAVSIVAMQVNCPLLQVAPSEELHSHCASLLQAISDLPHMVGQRLHFVQSALLDDKEPFFIRLLVPDDDDLGHEAAGVSEVDLQLPPGSTLGDLRAAALQMCGDRGFGTALPRLFCRGTFLAGSNGTSLASMDLDTAVPLQCLPSNAALRRGRGSVARISKADGRTAEHAGKPFSKQGMDPSGKAEPQALQAPVKGTEETKENEDSWFDDFWTAKAPTASAEDLKDNNSRPAEDSGRRTAQERGKQAMADRLKAQKQAADNKQKLQRAETERKKSAKVGDALPKRREEQRGTERSQALMRARDEESGLLLKNLDKVTIMGIYIYIYTYIVISMVPPIW